MPTQETTPPPFAAKPATSATTAPRTHSPITERNRMNMTDTSLPLATRPYSQPYYITDNPLYQTRDDLSSVSVNSSAPVIPPPRFPPSRE